MPQASVMLIFVYWMNMHPLEPIICVLFHVNVFILIPGLHKGTLFFIHYSNTKQSTTQTQLR